MNRYFLRKGTLKYQRQAPSPWSGKAWGEFIASVERELIWGVWGAVLPVETKGKASGGGSKGPIITEQVKANH